MPYPDHMFSDTFCARVTGECLQALEARASFNLVAATGVGVTFFVKYLQRRSPADFVYVNAYEMHDFTKQALYDQLAVSLGVPATNQQVQLQDLVDALRLRTQKSELVVLFLHRFDRLKGAVDQNFYDNLRFLLDVDRSKVVMVCVTNEPLPEMLKEHAAAALSLVPNTVYFPMYSPTDLREITGASSGQAADAQAVKLSGGHHLLLQVLMGCQSLENPLSDPMVELLVKDIYLGLDSRRRRLVEATVRNPRKHVEDMFLLGTGFVTARGDKNLVFSPVLQEYIARQTKGHLPVKERKLFELLQRNEGIVVSKQDIFDYVWSSDNGIASDWSLNALVYRLRNHTAFDKQRYDIESRKKEGYVLIDHLADR